MSGWQLYPDKIINFTSRVTRHSPLAIGATVVLCLLVAISLTWQWWVPYPQDAGPTAHYSDRLKPPSSTHFMGTDDLGRDVFSRVLAGTSVSLRIGLGIVVLSAIIGSTLGIVSGYFGGAIDETIMRITDGFISIPSLILALSIAAVLGRSLQNALLAIALVWWPWYTRLVRAETMRIREREYIEAARASGSTRIRVIVRHILPNCLTPILVQASLDLGYAILTAASLGFLGVGAQPPSPEWGLMVSLGRQFFPAYWWMATFPGLAIFTIVFSFNVLGDNLRDALDPRLR